MATADTAWEDLARLVEMDVEAVKVRAYNLCYGARPRLIADETILAYLSGRFQGPTGVMPA